MKLNVKALPLIALGAAPGWLWKQGRRRDGIAAAAGLGDLIGLDHFGAPVIAPVLMQEYGSTAENVCKRARALLERNHA